MKFAFILMLMLSGLLAAQELQSDSLKRDFKKYERDDELYLGYEKAKHQFDSLKLYNKNIELRELKRKAVKEAYGKLLNLESYSSLKVQNALLNDYFVKYKEGPLTKKFNTREEVEKRIGLYDEAFAATIGLMYLESSKEHMELQVKIFNDYIEKNLKRLGLTRKEFDALSENDREALWKEFKK
ncbi:hypothetical protein [Chryseobacterium sediminis]|uniref:Uncharacterized protein n=1 Tax=Chryseobacterium sediminis TaxID=1679494 RepID=A0A5B2U9I7_9FLAO|nr:hypothetical protein [Chryseobacterium sediminis]KAA2223096.1 hypothetical protein FW780_02495 [Chryseobacterium sediminis]